MTQSRMYIVRTVKNGGGAYLTERLMKSKLGKYRWDKHCKGMAAPLTESQARRAVKNYGGKMVAI